MLMSGGVAKITFLCRCGHFIISSQKQLFFLKFTASHLLPHGVVGLANMTFLYNSGHFMIQFIANNLISRLTLTPLNPMFCRNCQMGFLFSAWHNLIPGKDILLNWSPFLPMRQTYRCADLNISCTFHQNMFSEMTTNSITHGAWGLVNQSYVKFWTFNTISNKNILVNVRV